MRSRKRQWLVLALGVVVIGGAISEITQPFCGRADLRPPSVDAQRLEAHVRSLSSLPRDAAHPERLDAVARYLADELTAAGLRPTEQTYEVGGHTFRNIRVLLGSPSAERVVVGAHYDAYDALPGADDNASGVAVLLEVARALAQSPPAGAVELVAYTLEEPPHFATRNMGSAIHARALTQEGVHVRAMLSLEMLGYYSDAADSQHYPAPLLGLLYPSRGNFVAIVGRFGCEGIVRATKRAMSIAAIPVFAMVAPRSMPGIDLSDHANYWDEGFPAVMVTDTALFRNANYHTAADLPETLDYLRMARAAEGVYAAVVALASP